jgi:hypothetical protein
MWFRWAADAVLIAHFTFVVFVVLGGLLVLRWPRVAWVHAPLALYGAVIEFAGFVCPLTPLENWLRLRGGEAGYAGGFVEHYIIAALYPPGLTRTLQLSLGILVIVVNAFVYGMALRQRRLEARKLHRGSGTAL